MHGELTRILSTADAADPRLAEDLLPLLYGELRRLASAHLARERPGQTLQATALVHEAYLRLLGPEGANAAGWQGREQFFAAAANAMRRILIDRARAKGRVKRGGSASRLQLDLGSIALDDVPAEVVDLDQALLRLAEAEPQKAELVRLRFFAGLTMAQAAAILGISAATADRHWAFARAWLFKELSGAD